MNPAIRRILAGLVLAGTLAGASAAGGTRVDMRDWYAPTVAGWRTGWEFEDGSTATAEVLSVVSLGGEKTVVTRIDSSDGSFLETALRYREGVVSYGAISSVVAGGGGVVRPPGDGVATRLLPLVQGIGRTYRSRTIRGDVFDYGTGQRIGRFVHRERATLGGFEDKATPGGSFAGTLRQDAAADTRTYYADGSRLRVASAGTAWLGVGQGAVARESRTLVYRDGALVSDSGVVAGWRTSLTAPVDGRFDLAVYTPTR